jgi:hypothetical protein
MWREIEEHSDTLPASASSKILGKPRLGYLPRISHSCGYHSSDRLREDTASHSQRRSE